MISVSHVFAVLQCVMAIFYRIFILLGACCYYSAWPLDLSLDCCSNRPMHSRWGSWGFIWIDCPAAKRQKVAEHPGYSIDPDVTLVVEGETVETLGRGSIVLIIQVSCRNALCKGTWCEHSPRRQISWSSFSELAFLQHVDPQDAEQEWLFVTLQWLGSKQWPKHPSPKDIPQCHGYLLSNTRIGRMSAQDIHPAGAESLSSGLGLSIWRTQVPLKIYPRAESESWSFVRSMWNDVVGKLQSTCAFHMSLHNKW